LKTLFLLLTFYIFSLAEATPIQKCLAKAHQQVHIIDQSEDIENCFRTFKIQLSVDQCFALSKQEKMKKKSLDLNETLSSICFYETTFFKDTKSCLEKASEFKIATHHDEAVFECYRQFQDYLDMKQCIELSRKLIYPEKRSYLFQQCQNSH
jgi:hypothetical protein